MSLDTIFRLSSRIEILPILHASGDVAQEVRDTLISRPFDCLAVPLSPSVQDQLEHAVDELPHISLVTVPEPDQEGAAVVNFVPVDPCQAVIMGIRVAMGERIARSYIDREVTVYEPFSFTAPDPYALKRIGWPAFVAGLIPTLPSPTETGQGVNRVTWMAFKLHELELEYESILCLCHLSDWPWLRTAYQERQTYQLPERPVGLPSRYPVDPSTLYFALGELPFITELYERRRVELRSDRHVSVDGMKELLQEARNRWKTERRPGSRSICDWVSPQLLQRYLQYVRNLALLDRRLTPDLYTLVSAAKQMAGDAFAITLLETAKTYSFQEKADHAASTVEVGIGQLELPDGHVVQAKNRLLGPPLVWRSLRLRPTPAPMKSSRWAMSWNPYRQCSWPPEDNKIESFNAHVREQAQALLGADLVRVDKFTTSIKDGIDIRESLRHWYTRRRGDDGTVPAAGPQRRMEIYVREIPPARGKVEAVIFLFETPSDPAQYSWQATWHAEHAEESTLCFYATPFQNDMVGPGIGQARYGGALFLFPPRPIPDIWNDPALGFARTLEERLIAAASLHSRAPHIALVSPIHPRARWRLIARQFQRRLVTIPLSRFSAQTVDRLRRFHVLNGHEIRSYAAKFIRD
ncbi:MAG: hypothetical protein ACT4OO_05840 [Nitrospiraceae bacterium]